jgi:hypothetical protein
MTTVQEFMAIKLAATFDLDFDEAREIVADEVEGWRIAQIPLGWNQDITKASAKVKAQAWYSAQEAYKKYKNQKGKSHER